MGRVDKDPHGATNVVEVKVHPRRDDATVHNGRGPPPHIGKPPQIPVSHVTHDRDFRLFKQWFPWLVPIFVVANILIFIITMSVNDCPHHTLPQMPEKCVAPFLGRFSFQPLKENPLFGPSSSTLQKMGAVQVDKVVNQHQIWRLFTCMWLHGGVVHLLANMLSLLFIGIRLEQEFGFARIGALYVISGFGGSLLSSLFMKSSISVGASGALFGLLGGMLSELLINWTIYANKLAALLTLIVIVVINLAVGILPHVDNFAHIGGFVTGFLLGFVFLIRPQFKWLSQRNSHSGSSHSVKNKHKPYQYVLWIFSFLLVTAGLVAGLILLIGGANLHDRCSWCHYLSCIPSSKWTCQEPQNISCDSTQIGNHLNITCLSNGRSGNFLLNTTSSESQQLCSRLCSG